MTPLGVLIHDIPAESDPLWNVLDIVPITGLSIQGDQMAGMQIPTDSGHRFPASGHGFRYTPVSTMFSYRRSAQSLRLNLQL